MDVSYAGDVDGDGLEDLLIGTNRTYVPDTIGRAYLVLGSSILPGQAFDLARFIADASSTAAARSLSADLLIGATAVTIWICVEGPRQKIKGWWLAIPLSFGVAFACAAPFFLFLRERQLQAQELDSTS